MRVALICPSNMLYMPYVNNYKKILDEANVEYRIVYWDRFNSEISNGINVYRDNKIGHQRNYFDYLKYKRFIIKQLEETKYDKIIVFTLQLGYFLKNYLIKNFKGKYIFDIRDYNQIFKIHKFRRIIDNSNFTVLSSPGYKLWLPTSSKYIINHNTTVSDLNELRPIDVKIKSKINISTIGVIRHWDINIDLVSKLKNSNIFNLIFHGQGTINDRLREFVEVNKVENVKVYGRYEKEDEENLYRSTDLVNTLLYNNNPNCKSLLANRLYNSVVFGKPMLSLNGTFMAEQIKKYNLGLVLSSLEDIQDEIVDYMNQFNKTEFEIGRVNFLKEVIKDNENFKHRLKEFISHSTSCN
nr:hypothetical protein [Cytobacillus firmus]